MDSVRLYNTSKVWRLLDCKKTLKLWTLLDCTITQKYGYCQIVQSLKSMDTVRLYNQSKVQTCQIVQSLKKKLYTSSISSLICLLEPCCEETGREPIKYKLRHTFTHFISFNSFRVGQLFKWFFLCLSSYINLILESLLKG